MASDYQIRRVFSDLGELFGAEHAEHDDEGATMVHGLMKRLRKFHRHEQQEQESRRHAEMFGAPAPVREASYKLGDGRHVYYDDGPSGKETLRDASDLYTVLDELHGTGSPNLENQQAVSILNRLQSGVGLGEMHIGTLRKLLTKHQTAVAALRRTRDRQGQDMLDVASDGPDSRISTQGGQ